MFRTYNMEISYTNEDSIDIYTLEYSVNKDEKGPKQQYYTSIKKFGIDISKLQA